MEHIIQFGVTIDDDKVVNQAIESASKKIADDLEEVLFSKNWGRVSALKSDTEELVMRAVEKHMDEIIKFAAHEVAETMKRSKKYKAVLQAMEDAAND